MVNNIRREGNTGRDRKKVKREEEKKEERYY